MEFREGFRPFQQNKMMLSMKPLLGLLITSTCVLLLFVWYELQFSVNKCVFEIYDRNVIAFRVRSYLNQENRKPVIG